MNEEDDRNEDGQAVPDGDNAEKRLHTVIEARIQLVESKLKALADQRPPVAHLLTIAGIGLLTATALVAFIGGRPALSFWTPLASYLGLTCSPPGSRDEPLAAEDRCKRRKEGERLTTTIFLVDCC